MLRACCARCVPCLCALCAPACARCVRLFVRDCLCQIVCLCVHRTYPLTGDGSLQTSFVHVEDCAHAYVLALTKGKAGAVYHPVSENEPTFKVCLHDTVQAILRWKGHVGEKPEERGLVGEVYEA